MDKIERARELFWALEEGKIGQASEIAKRSFLIRQRISEFKN